MDEQTLEDYEIKFMKLSLIMYEIKFDHVLIKCETPLPKRSHNERRYCNWVYGHRTPIIIYFYKAFKWRSLLQNKKKFKLYSC
jgi:hypothetical protein